MGCTHNCSTCSSNCASKQKESFVEEANKLSKIKKVIGIVSGKGGVGKSLVCSLAASEMNKRGYSVAEAAANVGLDPRNFARLFTRETGMTPSEYKKKNSAKKSKL